MHVEFNFRYNNTFCDLHTRTEISCIHSTSTVPAFGRSRPDQGWVPACQTELAGGAYMLTSITFKGPLRGRQLDQEPPVE